MLQHQFKARSYSAGSIGVGREGAVFKPRHSDKPLTQQAPFRLSPDARATKRFPRQAEWRVMMLSKILIQEDGRLFVVNLEIRHRIYE